ncbi:MAG: sugar phosphate isomerase family [Armatimonadota bacterium]
MSEFKWRPASFIPFQDTEAVDRVRSIKREDLTKHPNPDFKIEIIPDSDFEFRWLMDMFYRIKTSADEGKQLVLIVPQPYTGYSKLAFLINKFKVNCSNLYTFNMDEYANEDGIIAPETWRPGFMYSMLNNFYANVDEDLRPPLNQINGLSNANIDSYGRMIEDLGGADCCYSGPGWTGHLAFIEPDAPEFDADLEEWKKMGPRIATLSPFTIAQNSLHGSLGMSGDLWSVPPKAATIGPAQVIAAKDHIDMHAITIDGSYASWQRLISRLCIHGPVTPRVPQSILQTLKTDCWVSESIAQDIEPLWDKGY